MEQLSFICILAKVEKIFPENFLKDGANCHPVSKFIAARQAHLHFLLFCQSTIGILASLLFAMLQSDVLHSFARAVRRMNRPS